jgi:uncharacterized protein (DUF2236 family)
MLVCSLILGDFPLCVRMGTFLSVQGGMGPISMTPVRSVETVFLSQTKKVMGIFRALGMGLAIVLLKLLMPEVVSGFEDTLISLFGLTSTMLANVHSSL